MARLKKVLKSVLRMAAKALQIRKKVKELKKSRKNKKQAVKLKDEIEAIGRDFKGKEPLFCIDKTAIDAVEHVQAQTDWKGKDITFHPHSSGRFEVIEEARRANFNPIEEYRWADDYSGRHSVSCDGSTSSSGYDGKGVRRVKSERFDNNRGRQH